MRNIKLTIQYDGTRYSGWQFQKNGRSIQEVIQNAIRKISGDRVNLIGSGRTDAGVHAAAQIANFRTPSKIPLKNIQMALNSILLKDIVITGIEETGLRFDSQRHAKAKIYRYTIANNDYVNPFMRHFAAKVFYKLDLGLMKRAVRYLMGRHDFRSFQTKDGAQRNSFRKIERIDIKRIGDLIYIDIEANGFLYNMARNIVGTLVEVGRGKIGAAAVKDIILKKDRRVCGPTMPAKGLCLMKVIY